MTTVSIIAVPFRTGGLRVLPKPQPTPQTPSAPDCGVANFLKRYAHFALGGAKLIRLARRGFSGGGSARALSLGAICPDGTGGSKVKCNAESFSLQSRRILVSQKEISLLRGDIGTVHPGQVHHFRILHTIYRRRHGGQATPEGPGKRPAFKPISDFPKTPPTGKGTDLSSSCLWLQQKRMYTGIFASP
jgi:hypothetical protein